MITPQFKRRDDAKEEGIIMISKSSSQNKLLSSRHQTHQFSIRNKLILLVSFLLLLVISYTNITNLILYFNDLDNSGDYYADESVQMDVELEENTSEPSKVNHTQGESEYDYEFATNERIEQGENEEDQKEAKAPSSPPDNILYLNVSDVSTLKEQQRKNKLSSYNIDILTIGSINSIERANTQMNTWGSHISRRHHWLATEFDDPDPNCHISTTNKTINGIVFTCEARNGKIFWRNRNAMNPLTLYWRNNFASRKWLFQKANPAGWLCAQRRFTAALSKLMTIYREGRNEFGIDLPDYLILGDDDTYVNIEMMEEQLIRTPNEEVKEKQLTLEDELKMVYPTQNTHVVWAGCRVRNPINQLNTTFPYGGFGVMFSKAALERLIHPLYCNDTLTANSGFEWEACEHFTPTYENWTIGEQQYFKAGMSVSDLMGSYTKNLEPFCLHSDWAIGHFVNHFNISRHVVPTAQFNSYKSDESQVHWNNNRMDDVKHSRLHAWHTGSEHYRIPYGNCKNEGEKCNATQGICHRMTSDMMKNVHNEVKLRFPDRYTKSSST